MSEDKARIERTVGISLKDRKATPQGLGRRGFGKAVLLGGAAAAAVGFGLIRSSEDKQDRLESEIFSDGFSGHFQGTIHVRKEAVIYDRPAAWTEYVTEWPFSTNPREDTQIEVIDEGEEFQILNPKLFFRAPHQFSIPGQVVTVGQSGHEKEVDLGASYVVFRAEEGMPESVVRSINLTATKWGCINMGGPDDLGYQPNGESDFSFRISPQAVTFDQ